MPWTPEARISDDLIYRSPQGHHYDGYFLARMLPTHSPLYTPPLRPADGWTGSEPPSAAVPNDDASPGLHRTEMTDVVLFAFIHNRADLLQQLWDYTNLGALLDGDDPLTREQLLALAADLLAAEKFEALRFLAAQFPRLLAPDGVGSLLHVACQLFASKDERRAEKAQIEKTAGTPSWTGWTMMGVVGCKE